jgi:hypothetical protein
MTMAVVADDQSVAASDGGNALELDVCEEPVREAGSGLHSLAAGESSQIRLASANTSVPSVRASRSDTPATRIPIGVSIGTFGSGRRRKSPSPSTR